MSVINRLVLVAFIFGFTPTFSNANEQSIQSGKFQYELIKRDSQMPKFGDCWTNSLKELEKRLQKFNWRASKSNGSKICQLFFGSSWPKNVSLRCYSKNVRLLDRCRYQCFLRLFQLLYCKSLVYFSYNVLCTGFILFFKLKYGWFYNFV